jgi:hypothetical protein
LTVLVLVSLASVGTSLLVRSESDDSGNFAIAGEARRSDDPVPRLDAIGPEVLIREGTSRGNLWRLIGYEVAAAAGRSERRVCTEFRSEVRGPQSCFPIVEPAPAVRWAFTERVAGATVLVIAAQPGADVTLDGAPIWLNSSPLSGFEGDLGLPVFIAAVRVDRGSEVAVEWPGGEMHFGDGSNRGTRANGARLVSFTSVETPGIFLERPTSASPVRDRWGRVTVGRTGEIGFLNPLDQLLTLAGHPDGRPHTAPVYDQEGNRVATCNRLFPIEERDDGDAGDPLGTCYELATRRSAQR